VLLLLFYLNDRLRFIGTRPIIHAIFLEGYAFFGLILTNMYLVLPQFGTGSV
jgi:hypothetical protein